MPSLREVLADRLARGLAPVAPAPVAQPPVPAVPAVDLQRLGQPVSQPSGSLVRLLAASLAGLAEARPWMVRPGSGASPEARVQQLAAVRAGGFSPAPPGALPVRRVLSLRDRGLLRSEAGSTLGDPQVPPQQLPPAGFYWGWSPPQGQWVLFPLPPQPSVAPVSWSVPGSPQLVM